MKIQYKFFSFSQNRLKSLYEEPRQQHDGKKIIVSLAKQTPQSTSVLNQLQVRNVEELFNGAAFCQLLDIISQGDVRMQKVNWNAKYEHENLNNLKILSTSMHAMNIEKNFDAVRISQKKNLDILELLQWFKKYFVENHVKYQNYDPQSRRRTNAQKLITQPRQSCEISKNRKQSSIKRTTINMKQKREPEDLVPEEELKNCYKIHKEIQRIIEDKQQITAKKFQLIKTLFSQKNIQRDSKTSNQENNLLSCPNQNKSYVEKFEPQVKIQGNLQQMQTMTGKTSIIKTGSSIKKNGYNLS